jgi:hypothetical protein
VRLEEENLPIISRNFIWEKLIPTVLTYLHLK